MKNVKSSSLLCLPQWDENRLIRLEGVCLHCYTFFPCCNGLDVMMLQSQSDVSAIGEEIGSEKKRSAKGESLEMKPRV